MGSALSTPPYAQSNNKNNTNNNNIMNLITYVFGFIMRSRHVTRRVIIIVLTFAHTFAKLKYVYCYI